jgi:hypothetical protein
MVAFQENRLMKTAKTENMPNEGTLINFYSHE